MGNLIVADQEYYEVAEKIYVFASEIDEYIHDYARIINAVVSEGCIQGEACDKLKQMGNIVEQNLSGLLEGIMAAQKLSMLEYISSIDDADEYLY